MAFREISSSKTQYWACQCKSGEMWVSTLNRPLGSKQEVVDYIKDNSELLLANYSEYRLVLVTQINSVDEYTI